MHLKSTSEMPILIDVAVTPVPGAFDTTGAVVVVVAAGATVALLLLPHAASASAMTTVNATKHRREFIPTSPVRPAS